MYTVCPKCALTLAVTAADLRAGQGYVRCGRCANVFNALLALSEESALAVAEAPAQHAASQRGPEPAGDEDRASGTTSRPALTEGDMAAGATAAAGAQTAARAEAPPEPRPPAAPALRLVDSPPRPLPPPDTPDDELEIEEYRGTGTFETIVLEGDTFLQTEELIPQEVLDSEIADVSRRAAEPREVEEDGAGGEVVVDTGNSGEFILMAGEDELPRELAALREATGEFRHEANLNAAGDDAASGLLSNAPAAARHRGWMIAGSALLAVLLAAQAINHWRNDLATHIGWYGPLSRMAAILREPLRPNWDLGAYDVHQLGAAMDAGDPHSLSVRLSLANHGARAQAMPLVRLTLFDRYGKAVSSGELQPAQYLPAALRGQPFIARDQRIDTEVRVQDPSQQASSFELDVCVPAAGGGVRCAGDTALVAGTP
ncbi:MAG TPA: zinc-ribbon and DUF3426 domain-containing protein [Steroidobacteraceae bacterium]|nr:zinc-ribbon and DUF3426 domain-containing protein [Steroidobacteraceae bacterium]